MRSVVPVRCAKIGYIAISTIMCLMGFLLILVPGVSMRFIGLFLGIMMIIFGIIKLVGYFSKDLFRLAFEYDLASGVLILALGVSLLIYTESIIFLFCTIFGILILSNALFKVQIAVEAKRFGIVKWWLILISAVLAAIFGLLLIFKPGEGMRLIMIFLGLALIFDGILNIITVLTSVKIIRDQYPDYIEIDYTDKN